jgi:hypothetical protein
MLSVCAVIAATGVPAGAATTQLAGASGSVAALSATSMEVQNPSSGQTTVSWTGTTNFSKVVHETVGAIAIGECATVTGTKSKKSKTTITATDITVRPASSSGSCTGPGGRFTGGPGLGTRTFRPGGVAGGPGPGAFGQGGPAGSGVRRSFGGGANFAVASGKVTAVSGSTISLSGAILGAFTARNSGSTSSKSNKKPTPPKTEKLKVTTTKSTTVSTTQSTTAAALAVGDCVSAFGQGSSTGAVTATTVSITSTGTTTCASGPGRFGGGFGGGPGGGFVTGPPGANG